MSAMFKNCKKLNNLDVKKFDTRNVQNFAEMFYYCEKVTFFRCLQF